MFLEPSGLSFLICIMGTKTLGGTQGFRQVESDTEARWGQQGSLYGH